MSRRAGSESLSDAAPEQARRRLARAADDWGGSWSGGRSGGRLELPVLAGVRHGRLGLRIELDEAPDGGTRVRWELEDEHWELQGTTVVVLILAGLGCAMAVLAPFFPRLLPLVPLGIMLGVGAWFFILARLHNAGTEEFFEHLAAASDTEDDQ